MGGALDESVTCLVRGPSSRYPRGFVWLIPAWLAILAGTVAIVSYRLSGQLPWWFGASELCALVIAALTLWGVLRTVRRHAFRADRSGIWLGVHSTRKRPKLRQVHYAWTDISHLRMVPRSYGLLLEITVRPTPHVVRRPSAGRQALTLLFSAIMPFGIGRGRPAMTAARDYPPRYLIKICDTSPMQLRLALSSLKPEALQVRLLPRKGALRFTVPPPRKPPTAIKRPPTGPHPPSRRPTPAGR